MSHPKYQDIASPVAKLTEECEELQQALCKAELFGWFNWHPDRPTRTNLDDVKAKMDDVVDAMERLLAHLRQAQVVWFVARQAKG